MKNLFNSKRKVKILTVLMLLCVSLTICPQQSDNDKVTLTKEEMFADYDEFVDIIKHVNPQLTLRKKLTGFDIIKHIEKQRNTIDTIKYSETFIKLLIDNLLMCNDMHNTNVFDQSAIKLLNNDTAKIIKLEQLFIQTDNRYYKKDRQSGYVKIPLFLYYHQGHYYSIGDCKKSYRDSNKTIDSIPQTAKILSINDIPIELIISESAEYSNTHYSWDKKRKKPFYFPVLPNSSIVKQKDGGISVEYEYQNKSKTFHYNIDMEKILIVGGGYLFFSDRDGYVDYFEKDKLLYIRLPRMANRDFYLGEIAKKGKNKPISKVVIDIRSNPGGSDDVWMSILKNIISKPLDIRADIGYKNTERAIKALKLDSLTRRVVRVPMLDNEEFGVLTWGKILQPSDSSLNFDGNIYVLQNRLIFSSAGSLSNVAKMHKKIVSVGETTGNLLGFGIAPIRFVLPNSGFVFQLEPVLDISNAKTLYDYFHDNVEVSVNISVEHIVKYFNSYNPNKTDKFIYSKEFLYNHDPVFQKVLELK